MRVEAMILLSWMSDAVLILCSTDHSMRCVDCKTVPSTGDPFTTDATASASGFAQAKPSSVISRLVLSGRGNLFRSSAV